MRKSTLLLFVLLVGTIATAPAPPDDEFDALEQEYNDAQQAWYEQISATQPSEEGVEAEKPPHPVAAFRPRFKAYAEKHGGQPEAIPALAWIINNAGMSSDPDSDGGASAKWAIERLTQSHAADAALAEHLPRLRYASYYIGREPLIGLYERVIETNQDRDAAAWAMFSLGYTYYGAMPGEPTKGDKQRAVELFRRTVKDYPDTRAAERAGGYIYELENLQIGMKAPEIIGTDADGQEIRLSKFRGQVVVLDFWGFW